MAAAAHGAKLSDAARRQRRGMTLVILYAGVLALVVSTLFTIWMAYHWGAIHFQRLDFRARRRGRLRRGGQPRP